MSVIEILLLATLIGIPSYEWLNSRDIKQQVLSGKLTKLQVYRQTIIFLSIPTFLLGLHIALSGITLNDLGVVDGVTINKTIGYGLLALLVCYLGLNLWRTSKDANTRAQAREQMQALAWILPTDKRELGWFVGGVSVTAGVCEELLFRGYLMTLLQGWLGMPLAIVVSSALFGLCHLYQGWENVLRTGFVGVVMALIYWWTGSLLLVILLHFILDAYAGCLYYLSQSAGVPSTDTTESSTNTR